MLNLGGEIIYPEPEVTGSTLILMLANGFTFVMAEILSHLTTNFNIIYRIVLDKGSRSVRSSNLEHQSEHQKFNLYWNRAYYWFNFTDFCQRNFKSTKYWTNETK